jgi:putative DNA primase/helicase
MSGKKRYPRFDRSDTGNAALFAHRYKDTVLFDHKQQRWLIWDTGKSRWTQDKTDQVREFAKRSGQIRFNVAGKLPNGTDHERDEQKREARWAIDSQSLYRIDAALELAKSVAPIADTGEHWDADPWLFGVANGIVDLQTGTLKQATQQDRITKFSPVVFDSDADCLRFKQFLGEVFEGDSELTRYVQRAVGYSLTGSTREQCLFACYGKGSNGKTTFLEIVFYIMGDYGVDLPFSTLETKKYAIGEGVNLPGARFAKSVETREGRQLDEARIKSWTGGDTISIRPMYHNGFSFQPTHKLWLAFNHKPVIRDDSDAMWRRIRLIPFLHTFDSAHADKGLLEKLKAEASGILNWAVAGCLAWQGGGLRTPAAVERSTSEYEAESDPLAPFFEDCCEADEAFTVPKGELWNAYQDWCRVNRERPVSRKAFAEKMKSRGFGEGSTGSVRFWAGLRLRAADTTGTTKGYCRDFSTGNCSIEKSGKEDEIASVASEQIPSLAAFYKEPGRA